MARKHKDRERWAFKITLTTRNEIVKEKYFDTPKWKKPALFRIKMLFYYQVLKARIRLNQPWWTFGASYRYGAPGNLEHIDPESGMVVSRIQQKEAVSLRRYWYHCLAKSEEILFWLWDLNEAHYSSAVHFLLLKLIVVPLPKLSEITRYEQGQEQISEEIQRLRKAHFHQKSNRHSLCSLSGSACTDKAILDTIQENI